MVIYGDGNEVCECVLENNLVVVSVCSKQSEPGSIVNCIL